MSPPGKVHMHSGLTHTVGRNSDSAIRRSRYWRCTWWNTLRYSTLRPATVAALLFVLSACSGDPGTGPIEVKWDRDACARCNMVLSDRQHSAQVRYTPADGTRGQLKKFDDIGCAVLWLEQQPWRNQAGVEIWVTDHLDGQWIDARTAHYVTGRLTPMQYGLGAQSDPAPGTIGFAAATEHIDEVERRFNVHGGNLEHAGPASPPGANEGRPAAAGE